MDNIVRLQIAMKWNLKELVQKPVGMYSKIRVKSERQKDQNRTPYEM